MPGRNEPSWRIGSAVSRRLWRSVQVSLRGVLEELVADRVGELVVVVLEVGDRRAASPALEPDDVEAGLGQLVRR